MIVSVLVSIKEIVAKGRNFPWLSPVLCHRCDGDGVWGHGFESAFFDGCVMGFYCDVIGVPGLSLCVEVASIWFFQTIPGFHQDNQGLYLLQIEQ